MRLQYLKLKNWLLLTLMGSLGFSSCHCGKDVADPKEEGSKVSLNPRNEIRLMYGVPTMNYRVSGRVTDPLGKPVENAKVTLLENGIEVNSDTLVGDPAMVKKYLDSQSATTDNKGRFEVKNSGVPQENVQLFVRAKGDDKYGKVVEVEVDKKSVDRTNATNQWDQGNFSKDVEIKLDK